MSIKNYKIYNNTLFGLDLNSSRASLNNNTATYNPNTNKTSPVNKTLRILESTNIPLSKSNSDIVSIAAIASFNSSLYDPFNIFNENSMRNLALVNRFIIRPAYEALKLSLETSITDNLNTFRLIYILILSIFISGVLFVYLFLWRPFENRLNTTVIFFYYFFHWVFYYFYSTKKISFIYLFINFSHLCF